MRGKLLVSCLIFGFLAREAQAYEWGLGAGRVQGCVGRVNGAEAVCSMGPALTVSLGLNLWGRDYRPAAHESPRLSEGNSSTPLWTHLDFGWRADRWEEVAIIVVAALILTTVGYALLYPFSSRVDIGMIGRSGWQQQKRADLQLFRNEAGIYLRAYLSQHFPMYIYGSGMFSQQNLSIAGQDETHQVFVKGVGLGFMSPTQGGLYAQGVWERSSLLDPSARDLIEDSGEVKVFKNSVAEILDGSSFELGYRWYF